MSATRRERRDLLNRLLRWEEPLEVILQALDRARWEGKEEIAILSPDHLVHVLERFRDGKLSAQQVEAWAKAVEACDDIGVGRGNLELMAHLLFELTQPELSRPLSPKSARQWIRKLSRAHSL